MNKTVLQSIADRLGESSSVLITVNHDPTVDQLTSAMALSQALSQQEVHSVVVYSGQVPSSIKFLGTDQVIERGVDSLRDFIVLLHRDKASKFRYKEDGDYVKIFITPYQGGISKDDLIFEQGEFNVDTVVCIGVQDRGQIDNAIRDHGRILHNASIITINNKKDRSDMGTTNWNEPKSATYSEMIFALIGMIDRDLVDKSIASDLLTGIISATDHFRSPITSPELMTTASRLMSKGANQANIFKHLEQPPPAPKPQKPKLIKQTSKKPIETVKKIKTRGPAASGKKVNKDGHDQKNDENSVPNTAQLKPPLPPTATQDDNDALRKVQEAAGAVKLDQGSEKSKQAQKPTPPEPEEDEQFDSGEILVSHEMPKPLDISSIEKRRAKKSKTNNAEGASPAENEAAVTPKPSPGQSSSTSPVNDGENASPVAGNNASPNIPPAPIVSPQSVNKSTSGPAPGVQSASAPVPPATAAAPQVAQGQNASNQPMNRVNPPSPAPSTQAMAPSAGFTQSPHPPSPIGFAPPPANSSPMAAPSFNAPAPSVQPSSAASFAPPPPPSLQPKPQTQPSAAAPASFAPPPIANNPGSQPATGLNSSAPQPAAMSHNGFKPPSPQGATSSDAAIADARRAVDEAMRGKDFNPSGRPRSDIGAQTIAAPTHGPNITPPSPAEWAQEHISPPNLGVATPSASAGSVAPPPPPPLPPGTPPPPPPPTK